MKNCYLNLRRLAMHVLMSVSKALQPLFPTLPQRTVVIIGGLGQTRSLLLSLMANFFAYFKRVDRSIAPRLAQTLRDLGVCEGDTLLMLIDEDQFMKVGLPFRQGTQSIVNHHQDLLIQIEALVGETGTILMPCDSVDDPKYWSHKGRVYDSTRSNAKGIVGRFHRKHGALLSVSPLLGLAAKGMRAQQLVKGQLDAAPYPMGVGSPWAKLLECNTKVAIIGCSSVVNLPLLMPAHMTPERYKRPSFFHRPFTFSVVDEGKRLRMVELNVHARLYGPDYTLTSYAAFNAFEKHLNDKYSLYKVGRVADIPVTVFDYKLQYEAVVSENAQGVFLEDAFYW